MGCVIIFSCGKTDFDGLEDGDPACDGGRGGRGACPAWAHAHDEHEEGAATETTVATATHLDRLDDGGDGPAQGEHDTAPHRADDGLFLRRTGGGGRRRAGAYVAQDEL